MNQSNLPTASSSTFYSKDALILKKIDNIDNAPIHKFLKYHCFFECVNVIAQPIHSVYHFKAWILWHIEEEKDRVILLMWTLKRRAKMVLIQKKLKLQHKHTYQCSCHHRTFLNLHQQKRHVQIPVSNQSEQTVFQNIPELLNRGIKQNLP